MSKKRDFRFIFREREFQNSADGAKAKELLPSNLKTALNELEEHFEKLAESYNTRIAKSPWLD